MTAKSVAGDHGKSWRAGCFCSRCRSRATSTRCCSSPTCSTTAASPSPSSTPVSMRFDPALHQEFDFDTVPGGIRAEVTADASGNIIEIILTMNEAMEATTAVDDVLASVITDEARPVTEPISPVIMFRVYEWSPYHSMSSHPKLSRATIVLRLSSDARAGAARRSEAALAGGLAAALCRPRLGLGLKEQMLLFPGRNHLGWSATAGDGQRWPRDGGGNREGSHDTRGVTRPRSACLFIDGNLLAVQKAAARLGLPTLVLRTGRAACLGSFLPFPKLYEMGYLPRQRVSNLFHGIFYSICCKSQSSIK
ncbi:hypothetical protein PR202_ga27871 [Eleusine coracana subsp. coracana]|uniref:Uncharacterized protein n=1 Tax=Eleusine coracana subsp. coracana TaxID=191504 RepID=A0AAV5DH33_ELECO|nr:hypothetical protein PR202_ga27871 [Eleusine coracana subsp. coracana]